MKGNCWKYSCEPEKTRSRHRPLIHERCFYISVFRLTRPSNYTHTLFDSSTPLDPTQHVLSLWSFKMKYSPYRDEIDVQRTWTHRSGVMVHDSRSVRSGPLGGLGHPGLGWFHPISPIPPGYIQTASYGRFSSCTLSLSSQIWSSSRGWSLPSFTSQWFPSSTPLSP